jgi:hypothetical protein
VGGVALLVGYMFHIGMISTVAAGQKEYEEEQEEEEDEEEGIVDAGTAADFLNMGGLGDLGIPGSS